MKNLTNIFTNILLISAFVCLLIFNIKVSNNETDAKREVAKRANVIPLVQTQKAFAGPCGRRGCEGSKGDCGESHTVIEIGPIEIIRHCNGTDMDEPKKESIDQGEESFQKER
ncbi:hypothetical protein LX73_1338 [Fodinibius salinus]|uniref:Uncharacterized protein n=1 Tax=Fodinibius salinus TaxID=860790 RepID=A0A5D3YLS6_9BACT|nr:hypothetical protein [Fodinibius salinus]TYP93631.1 hypothetical protein LX73_1338 [Fodinibius salinus]